MSRPSRIISVFSSKGGVGKTIIAANLAVSLAQFGRKVAFLDVDLQHGGDVAKMLNLKTPQTIFSLSSSLPKLAKSGGSIKKFMNHHYSGVDVLPAVSRPKEIPHITTERLQATFDLLRLEYEYIIIDAGSFFTDALIHVFDNSNLILLVATPDVLSVYQTEWSLDTVESLHFPLHMVKLLLNRAESRGGVLGQDLKPALRCEIIGSVPSDGRIAGNSVNRGVPFVMDSPRAKIAEAVKKLAEDLISREDIYITKVDRPRTEDKAAHAGQFWERHGLASKAQVDTTSDKDEIIILKKAVHARLIEELDLKRMDVTAVGKDPNRARQLRERTTKVVSSVLAEKASGLISSYEVRKELVKEIVDEALGLGPLEDLLRDDEITEIMVNNKDQIYIERHGKIELTSKKFISNEQVRAVIERIVAPLGRRIDESVPMVDARLPDGSRVNAIIPPLSLTGPTLTIRKFSRERYSMDDMVKFGTLTRDMVEFLKACVLLRKNMLISGGTGSGKTTVLNALSQFIPMNERIITIEDAAEVKLKQAHWISLESRMTNIEGKGGVPIRELFRNSLRMRPDRIIIGECRGEETPDMLQAMNTGHDGSLSTIHANSTHHVLSRLDTMVLMSGIELPVRAIREQIAAAIHIIVHTARLNDGSRKVTCITEIVGLKSDTEEIEMKDIFVFKQTGIDENRKVLGEFMTTGHIPSFASEMKIKGIDFPVDIFKTSQKSQ